MSKYFSKKRFELRFDLSNKGNDREFDKWADWHEKEYYNKVPPAAYIEYLKNEHNLEIWAGKWIDNPKKKKTDNTAIPLTKEQAEYIISDFRVRRGDLRGAIICSLMWSGGLRISDVLGSITKKQVYLLDSQVRNEIRLIEQKTGKDKVVYIYDLDSAESERGKLYFMLKEYRKELNNLRNDKPIFYNQKQGTNLTTRGFNFLLNNYRGEKNLYIGVLNIEKCSCHCFRKGAATYLAMVKKHSIEGVRDFLNHADTSTTRRYAKVLTPEQHAINKALEL